MSSDAPVKFGIGQPVPRTDDPKLLTGRGMYTDDHSIDGQCHAFFVRSPIAHGRIAALDTAEAVAAPGVLTICTGEDLRRDGVRDIPCSVAIKNRDGSEANVPSRPALAVGQVKYTGDPVAMVVAETLEQARDAAERIVLEIEARPAVSDAVTAAQDGASPVWNDTSDNICLDFHLGDEDAVRRAFADAAHITRLTLTNTKISVSAMEPRSAVAEYGNHRFTLTVGTQGVTGYRNAMANIFGVDSDKMQVVSREVGGSFGMKGATYNESVALLYAARRLSRPVKWTADRSESFLSDHPGRASTLDLELGLDADGNFLGLRVDGVGDLGAYVTAMGALPATTVTSRNIISVYKTPTISYNVRCMFTNTVPTGPYRGAGRPESKFFLERLIDRAAAETGRDRIELRRRNMITPDMMPHETPVGLTYDSGEFEALMDEALERADYAEYEARKRASADAGKLRGIGIVPYLENTAPPGTELADIRFEDDGKVTLVTGTKDFGMGHATPFAQVISSRLGIPFDRIGIVQHDSDEMSVGAGGSGGSRSIIATGGAIVECSDAIIEHGKKLAGHIMEAAVEDIEFADGVFSVAGTDRRIDIMKLAARGRAAANLPEGVPSSLSAKVRHDTHPSSFPNGCHIVEVEIDPDTGLARVDRYTVVDDFGVMINPPIVEGQVHGGVMQGIGQVIGENTVYDGEGQLLTGTYMDYAMPRADEVSRIDFSTRPVPCTTNPLGVKGCGEAGNGGSFPAVYNAIMDALDGNGVRELGIPATPHRIWQALRNGD